MAGLISNGSFVLGDPNTRDLYLGAGLKQGDIDGKHYIAVDETVLWEGEANKNTLNITLNESLGNFEKVKFIFDPRVGATAGTVQENVCKTSDTSTKYLINGCYANGGDFWITLWTINAYDKSITNHSCYYKSLTTTAVKTEQTNAYLYKVVGVNRKRG